MRKCRICKNRIPEHHKFCSNCGANQDAALSRQGTTYTVFSSLGSWLRNLFSEEMDEPVDSALMDLDFGDNDSGLGEIENYALQKPKDRPRQSILAYSYKHAADLRMHKQLFGWGYPDEHQALSILSNICEEDLAASISEITHSRSHLLLNDALNNAISLYDKSIKAKPEDPTFYIGRAFYFRYLAGWLLMAFHIFPNYESPYSQTTHKVPFYTRNICLGMLSERGLNTSIPVDLGAKAIWLYRHAEADYLKSLELDPTNPEIYLRTSHMQRQQGNTIRADINRNKAHALLNRAIDADKSDFESYLLRAGIFEEIGEFSLAIIDIEKAITLSTSEIHLNSIKDRLEKLRKNSPQNQIPG